MGVRAKFRSLGSVLKDRVIVRKLLSSVPKKFLPLIASMEQYCDIDKILFEDAVGRVKAFEERLKAFEEPEENDQSKLLMTSASNQKMEDQDSWHYGKGRGDGNQGCGQGFGRGRGRGDKSDYRCFEYGEFGHFVYECTK
ncbi:hypothetical protein L1987_05518 [Smallanthus sonchifolius]|uniref:Uncharacterized protein n=1 Tax=Smallanthus sonchifolius TaxID=185202 RepID=A0ACB9JVK5_9ASTR|nr:hypothetical protein L1987_05518 [Smallanthus sonchifolius]